MVVKLLAFAFPGFLVLPLWRRTTFHAVDVFCPKFIPCPWFQRPISFMQGCVETMSIFQELDLHDQIIESGSLPPITAMQDHLASSFF